MPWNLGNADQTRPRQAGTATRWLQPRDRARNAATPVGLGAAEAMAPDDHPRGRAAVGRPWPAGQTLLPVVAAGPGRLRLPTVRSAWQEAAGSSPCTVAAAVP